MSQAVVASMQYALLVLMYYAATHPVTTLSAINLAAGTGRFEKSSETGANSG